jgi:phosphopentomutase
VLPLIIILISSMVQPALKLLDFFAQFTKAPVDHQSEAGGQVSFATLKSQHSSTALGHAESLGQTDVRRWIAYWKDKGLFTQE